MYIFEAEKETEAKKNKINHIKNTVESFYKPPGTGCLFLEASFRVADLKHAIHLTHKSNHFSSHLPPSYPTSNEN